MSQVLLAEERSSEKLFAVKVLKKDVLFQDEDTESAMVERRVLGLSGRPHFLTSLYCAFQTEVCGSEERQRTPTHRSQINTGSNGEERDGTHIHTLTAQQH